MKTSQTIFALVSLLLCIGIAQSQNKNTNAESALLRRKRLELIKAVEDSKASLAQLLVYREASLRAAIKERDQFKELVEQHLASPERIKESEQRIINAKIEIDKVRESMKAADAQLAHIKETLGDENSKDKSAAFNEDPLEELQRLVLTAEKQPAQACALKLNQAPEVRGFHFGQSYQDIVDRLGQAVANFRYGIDKPDEVGLRSVTLQGTELKFRARQAEAERFKDIGDVELKFLDDHLASVKITYDSDVTWRNNLEFTAAVADGLKLPTQGWRGNDPTLLNCEGFTVITTSRGLWSTLTLKARGLEAELERRRQNIDNNKRRTFKP